MPNIVNFTARLNLTYRELAEKIGKTTGFVGQLASGASSVSYDTMLDLVKLGINANELFGDELGKSFKKQCHEEYIKENNGVISANGDVKSIVIAGLRKILDDVGG